MLIVALAFPDALVVASVFVRSPTTTFASVIPAFVRASSIAFWISSFVRSFVASIALMAASTTTLTSATFSASVFGILAMVLLYPLLFHS